MKRIISLKEISPNTWESVYSGRKGQYEVMVFADERFGSSTCNCRCYFYPCRHINEVKSTINKRQRWKKLVLQLKAKLYKTHLSTPLFFGHLPFIRGKNSGQ